MAKRNIVITGGAGFIGSHVVRLFVNKYPEYNIINLDKLTYAGNLANLKDVEEKPNYKFVKMDICDFDAFYKLMQDEHIDGIIHLAAEAHVDRSIKDPFTFARTNVMGTLSLLQAAKLYWESLPEKYEGKRFYHISTDEVYGALEMIRPKGIKPPFTTTTSSTEHHMAYGDEFHARAIDMIFHKGRIAETYNIGGFNEWKNIDIIKVVINTVDHLLGRKKNEDLDLIAFVTDRLGHDARYAIDSTKLQKKLDWEPSLQFEEGIEKNVRWYLDNQAWMDNVTSGDYLKYYEDMYQSR